ncbi:DUF1800 domain-containing protein [Pseudoalteromonas phenolica]|uniref:DUF1800 domain-containing protein n=1 Tax=Pseudoalteromonas phenolica TaxID=161398 RepID=UPI00110B4AAA|nr:DUF1800 domain-containing protein [Pseudoalteromonas phenolica]TMO56622.1 DUF1800 domain-containing protein [Pseudoalteromonas phenolica]
MITRYVYLILFASLITGCGGGSQSEEAVPEQPAIADSDNSDGSGSDGDGSDDDSGDGSDQDSGNDSSDETKAPVIAIKLDSDTFKQGEIVKVKVELTEQDSQTVSFAWQQLSGPAIELTTTDSLEFDASKNSTAVDENYHFLVTVTNAAGLSTQQEVRFSVLKDMNEAQASRLLHQASLGPTYNEILAVTGKSYEQWLDEQIDLPITYHSPLVENYPDRDEPNQINRIDAWWKASMNAEDLLRQRVAFALSEIFVVSDLNTSLSGEPEGMAAYYDILLEHAFGNYRELLEQVTLSPVMGVYLSHLGNEKADPERNIRPDENYAREVMQLFTIGLNELNLNGTNKLDENGELIPTYGQSEIEGFAKVFTGWTFAYSARWSRPSRNYTLPMQAFEDYHSNAEKILLNGEVIPANMSAEQSLEIALDNLFNHDNVAPFISKQLIQRLITSNPSPGYVERVATVFNDNGKGERGDLAATVKAIYLDNEARGLGTPLAHFGKIKEPLLKTVQFWRVFNAKTLNNRYYTWNLPSTYGQGPLQSPSVFNFFRPDFQPGELASTEFVAPELQIANDAALIGIINTHYADLVWRVAERHDELNENSLYLYMQADHDLINMNGLSAVIDKYDLLFFAGNMSQEMRQALIDMDEFFASRDSYQRISNLVYLISISPEFTLQQ